MTNLSIIVAMSKNRVIGKENKLPWHLSDDLKNFKKITTGKTIIMGRMTYESIGKPLPNRRNIVLSRNLKDSQVIIANNIEQAINFSKKENEVFIIGGEDIYIQTLEKAKKLYLTTIEEEIDGDKYFPNFDFSNWKKIESNSYKKNAYNSHDFKCEIFLNDTYLI